MKTCTKCNQSKALTEFYKQSGHRDGLQYKCKVCKKAANKKLNLSSVVVAPACELAKEHTGQTFVT